MSGRHLTPRRTQPKRPRHTQKTPTTVPRSSRACHRCCHSFPTANCGAKPNALAESTRQSRRTVHLHSIPWHSTPNQHCHLIFIMYLSFIEECRPPQSHNVAEANLGTGTDHQCSFPHTSNHNTARQDRQHQKSPLLFTIPLQRCAMRTFCA